MQGRALLLALTKSGDFAKLYTANLRSTGANLLNARRPANANRRVLWASYFRFVNWHVNNLSW